MKVGRKQYHIPVSIGRSQNQAFAHERSNLLFGKIHYRDNLPSNKFLWLVPPCDLRRTSADTQRAKINLEFIRGLSGLGENRGFENGSNAHFYTLEFVPGEIHYFRFFDCTDVAFFALLLSGAKLCKMAKTESNMLALGTSAPEFRLPDTNSNYFYSFDDLRGEKGTLVMFICNHCPFVHHVLDEVLMLVNDYRVLGIGVMAISSNDAVQYPQDGPAEMKEFAFRNRIDFPYLYDETQDVARAFDAACTPDFYLFDPQDKLFYRGRLDGSRPGNGIPLSGSDLRSALDSVIFNRTFNQQQLPSIGCGIKWK